MPLRWALLSADDENQGILGNIHNHAEQHSRPGGVSATQPSSLGQSLQRGSDGSPSLRVFASLKGWSALLITHPGEEVQCLTLQPRNSGPVKSMTGSYPTASQARFQPSAPDLQLYYM